jgi:hypothetical protein
MSFGCLPQKNLDVQCPAQAIAPHMLHVSPRSLTQILDQAVMVLKVRQILFEIILDIKRDLPYINRPTSQQHIA